MHDSDVFWASLFTRDGNKADKGGSRVPKARKAGGANTPFSTPTPTPPPLPHPHLSPHPHHPYHLFCFFQSVRQIVKRVKEIFALYVSKDMRFTKALEDSAKVAAFVNVQKVIKQGWTPAVEKNVSGVSTTICVLFILRQQSPDIKPLFTGLCEVQTLRPCGLAMKA